LQTAEETASPDSDPEQAALAFICKRLKLNLKKLSEEEKKVAEKDCTEVGLAEKSNPTAREKVINMKLQNGGNQNSSDSFFKFNLSRLQINAKAACSGSLSGLAVSSAVCKKSSRGLSSGTLKKSSLCASRRSRAILFMSCCIT